jgi:O-methyltransferase
MDIQGRDPYRSVVGTLKSVRRFVRRFGVDVVRYHALPVDLTPAERALVGFVRPFTMTSPERVAALANAVRWVVDTKTAGGFVECGVWRGGSMMAIAKTLLDCGVDDRELYLFDTFTGMTAPTARDRDHKGAAAAVRFEQTRDADDAAKWCRVGIATVRRNLALTGYPQQRLHFVAGKVEDTIPDGAPERIALLRLDTDWYASTKHELVHLWPRLVSGGVCIIDDYGHWAGSRQAVDEYLDEQGLRVLMHRIDYSGRLIVKP